MIETQETKTGEKQITAEEKIKQADEFWAQHSEGTKVKLTVYMGEKDSFIKDYQRKTKQQIMYFLAGHRNYSFVLTKAAVDKCNKAELSELSVRYEVDRWYLTMTITNSTGQS